MKKGPWPYRLVVCAHEDGRLLALDDTRQDQRALLLFTSPYHAGDYLVHTNTTARLYGVLAEALPLEVAKWLGAGLRRFTLDKCPRCPVFTSMRIGTLSRREDFVKTWAIHRVTRAD